MITVHQPVALASCSLRKEVMKVPITGTTQKKQISPRTIRTSHGAWPMLRGVFSLWDLAGVSMSAGAAVVAIRRASSRLKLRTWYHITGITAIIRSTTIADALP